MAFLGVDDDLIDEICRPDRDPDNVFDILRRGANVNYYSDGGDTPLMLASYHGREAIVL